VGTDGKTALLWGNFKLPFAADVLVPAVGVFGSRELAGGVGVRVGRTPTHLVVAAGPWAVWLPIDARGRFPDVASVVARPAPTPVARVPHRPLGPRQAAGVRGRRARPRRRRPGAGPDRPAGRGHGPRYHPRHRPHPLRTEDRRETSHEAERPRLLPPARAGRA